MCLILIIPPDSCKMFPLYNLLNRPHSTHFSLNDSDKGSIAYMRMKCIYTESNRPYILEAVS